MKRFNYKIFLNSGQSRVDISILAENEKDALNKFESIRESEEFINNTNGMKITKILIDLEGESINEVDQSRFDLKPSDKEKGYFIVVDKKTMIYIKFKKNNFNSCQEPVFLDDRQLSASEIAESMRSIGDYMHQYHNDLV